MAADVVQRQGARCLEFTQMAIAVDIQISLFS
jgi:hypothetical protein